MLKPKKGYNGVVEGMIHRCFCANGSSCLKIKIEPLNVDIVPSIQVQWRGSMYKSAKRSSHLNVETELRFSVYLMSHLLQILQFYKQPCLQLAKNVHTDYQSTAMLKTTTVLNTVSTHQIPAHNRGYSGPLKLKVPKSVNFSLGRWYSIPPQTQIQKSLTISMGVFWTNIGVNWEFLAQIYPHPVQNLLTQVSHCITDILSHNMCVEIKIS